ncbi:MAG: sigma-70 family RNA polymerase sigma factor [Gammaproteobacteria bacterium]|nr:sigma-70 family RNA polymerase sigma factor [Gammaproteobacteria bacterium]
MPTKKVPMKKIIEVLRLHHETDLSQRQISKACNLSTGAVSKYLSLAKAKGLSANNLNKLCFSATTDVWM